MGPQKGGRQWSWLGRWGSHFLLTHFRQEPVK